MTESSAKSELRLSQVITTYGPGAMVDLPTRSVIVGGLDRWEMSARDSWRTIDEPRALALLEDRLSRDEGPIAPGTKLTLRTPPVDPKLPGREPPGIAATVFPCWFIVNDDEPIDGGRRRRLVHWQHLDPSGGRTKFLTEKSKKAEVTPIRFVAACKKGHIQDIDWPYWIHQGGPKCGEPLWLEEKGATGDPRNIRIVCGCGKAISLENAQIAGRFGNCRGKQPWLERDEEKGCDQPLRFLTRSATNAYFPQVLTLISLPAPEDQLAQLVQENWAKLRKSLSDEPPLKYLLMGDDVLREVFRNFAEGDLMEAIRQFDKSILQSLDKKPKYAEFELLASGRAVIGENRPDAKLHAETLTRDAWGGDDARLSGIASVVAVHRLREVSCLYGFTRFEAAPAAIDGDIEEISISVDGAPLASELTWLPAIEQFGEGVFLTLDPGMIAGWASSEGVAAREEILRKGFARWTAKRFQGKTAPEFPGVGYYLLHALSHSAMAEVALECGYPTTALKERIYALPAEGGVNHFGLLLYTATAGAQGTLGGLLAILPRLGEILLRALDNLLVCSSDPICSENRPEMQGDDRAVHGAACHSCLLVPETSCEYRNLFLDRALVVQTLSERRAAFFS